MVGRTSGRSPVMSPVIAAVWLRRAVLGAFLALVILFDSPVPLPGITTGVALLAGACTAMLVAARGHGWIWPGYLVFLAGVAWSAAASGAPGVWPAFREQVSFVLLLWSVADDVRTWLDESGEERGLAAWVTFLLVALALMLPQLAGPRSVFDYGRPLHYAALRQWTGYPEIGMLCVLGGSATWAIASATRDRSLLAAVLTLCAGFGLAIVYLQSRAALLALGVAAVWTAASSWWRWRSWVGAAAVVVGIVAAAGAAWRAPQLAERLMTASAVNPGQDRPMAMRVDVWRRAWALARSHPWTGVGPGQFQREYTRAGGTDASPHAHNIVLHVAAEYGVLTLVCYLGLWGRLLWLTWVAAGRSLSAQAAWATHAMLLGFFLRSLLDYYLSGIDTSLRMLCLMAFVWGLAESIAARPRAAQRPRAGGIGAPPPVSSLVSS